MKVKELSYIIDGVMAARYHLVIIGHQKPDEFKSVGLVLLN